MGVGVTDSEFSAEQLIGDVIGRETGQMLRFTSIARRGVDPEGVHQLRVATRRLRSELRLLRPLLISRWCDSVTKDLSWLGTALGNYRDVDVLIALLEEISKADPTLDQRVIREAKEDRPRRQRRVVQVLDRARYRSLMVALTRGVLSPPLRSSHQDPSTVIVTQLYDSWREVRTAAGEPHADDTRLHRIRILTKRARYATEVATPILGDGGRAIIERFAKIQDILGMQHDMTVARRFITNWYDSPLAAQGVDPGDARDVWVAAMDSSARIRHDTWREPLAEVIVLIDDLGLSPSKWSNPDELL